MCGIAGLCNWKGDVKKNIDRMNVRMCHRGPDAEGCFIEMDESVAMGHRRLAIVDLSPNGAQPMSSHSGRFVIVFNGEIYNHRELRKLLIEDGKVEKFRGSSDTEVLLEVFENYGVQRGIQMCKGMFAIALYDRMDKTITLIRDRMGEKPLYYGWVNNSFVFASDVGCIAALDGFTNGINKNILPFFFTHGYIPAPYSIYENIFKLAAGTILTIKRPYANFEIKTYWSMKEVAIQGERNKFKGTEEEATQQLEKLLKASIREQMVADVPVGAFLSSGVDSTTIVALMQSISSNATRSFTIGIEEQLYNEAEVASNIAEYLGTKHTELYISERDVMEVIPNLSNIFGEPYADSSQIPTYLVSKITKEHVTVSLSGDGGDELFCGYTHYNSIESIWKKVKKIPYPVRCLTSSMILNTPLSQNEKIEKKLNYLKAKGIGELYDGFKEEPIVKKLCIDKNEFSYKQMQYEDVSLKESYHNLMLMDILVCFPDDILAKVDRTGMAVSLETRMPMLDKDVVEFVWTLPMEYKYSGGVTKKILRNILYSYVPKEIVDVPKRGFSIPISKWLKEPKLRAWAEALIDKKTIEQQGILDADVVWNIWNDYINNGNWRVQIWYILMFQEWMCNRGVIY